jgi:hypothetical protein
MHREVEQRPEIPGQTRGVQSAVGRLRDMSMAVAVEKYRLQPI